MAGAAFGEVDASDAPSHALSCEFEEAQLADGEELGAGAIALEEVLELVFDIASVGSAAHIDEVEDDEATEIAEAELAADLVGGFHVCSERGCFGVGGAAHLAGVDIDGDEGFGFVDDESPAAWEGDLALVDRLDLRFETKGMEEGFFFCRSGGVLWWHAARQF